jgi:hypothetical protein
MSIEIDLLYECGAAGIVFRPRGGRLRPLLTLGPVPGDLKTRVEANKERLLLLFVEAFDWSEFEVESDATELPEALSVVCNAQHTAQPDPLLGSFSQSASPPVLKPRSLAATD